MSGRVFFDTNVLIYLYDTSAPEKQSRARTLLEEHGPTGSGYLSTQVLQEFFVNVAQKFPRRLSHEEALQATMDLSRLPLIQIDPPMILDAISMSKDLQTSFWDALILRAAVEARCERLLSEDFQHGRNIGELRIENPFVE